MHLSFLMRKLQKLWLQSQLTSMIHKGQQQKMLAVSRDWKFFVL
uniref:Uncharacterized protein n=1 Tax=Arundo donax TaxID=35708 RepID=A0A0A9G757_ARUDO